MGMRLLLLQHMTFFRVCHLVQLLLLRLHLMARGAPLSVVGVANAFNAAR